MTVSEKNSSRAEKAAAINGLYCITAEEYSRGRDNLTVVREMLQAGAKIVQYREKDMQMLRQYRQCVEIRKMTADAGALLIIDDHVDLALAVEADGVHIGQTDLPIEKARELVGDDILVGLSTHSPVQARDAILRGADYIGVGPLFETHTKKDVCAPVGLEYLDYVIEHIKLPFVTLGGVKLANIDSVLAHGATCVALVTEIVGANDIGLMVTELTRRIKAAQN